jgi:Family of unknown function (DUF6376)
MKKLIILLAIVFLSGCGLLDKANSTLQYVNEMTDYINEADQFANDIPQLVDEAAQNPENVQALEDRLLSMKTEIEEVNELEPPGVAEDLHNKVLGYNDQALEGINLALDQIENGTIDPSFLKNSELLTTIDEIREIKSNLENLGN